MKETVWFTKKMNGELKKVPFPEQCILNESLPGYDIDSEISDILSNKYLYDVNLLNAHGHSPLSTAAYLGSIRYVKLLLELDAKVEFKDSDGWTALHFAMAAKNYDIAKLLMAAGGNPKELTNDGQRALDFVKDRKTRSFLEKYGERCIMGDMRTSDC